MRHIYSRIIITHYVTDNAEVGTSSYRWTLNSDKRKWNITRKALGQIIKDLVMQTDHQSHKISGENTLKPWRVKPHNYELEKECKEVRKLSKVLGTMWNVWIFILKPLRDH